MLSQTHYGNWAQRGWNILLCGEDCGCCGRNFSSCGETFYGHGVGGIFRCVAKIMDAVDEIFRRVVKHFMGTAWVEYFVVW